MVVPAMENPMNTGMTHTMNLMAFGTLFLTVTIKAYCMSWLFKRRKENGV